MFRVFVILSVLLIGITAKPWNKHENKEVKKAIVSIDENGRLSWEAEPPEYMRDIQSEVDPRMAIWKNVPNTDPAAGDQPEPLKRYFSIEYIQKSEDDTDDIDHPVEGGGHLQPEKDSDDLYHREVLGPVFYQDDTKAAAPAHVPPQREYSELEVDLDPFYHK